MSATFWNMRRRKAALKQMETTQETTPAVETIEPVEEKKAEEKKPATRKKNGKSDN